MIKFKSVISNIDKSIFKGKIRELVFYAKEKILIQKLKFRFKYHFSASYKSVSPSELDKLCNHYSTDKAIYFDLLSGRDNHNYSDVYSRLFSHCRGSVKYVFECGIGTTNNLITSNMGSKGSPGASLRVWRDYFPNALIYGADIDKSILFEEERIKTFYVDQTSPESIDELWREISHKEFDLLIDDGLHEFHAGIQLFTSSKEKIAPHGIYIIEDVSIEDLLKYYTYFSGQDEFIIDYLNLYRPNKSLSDNNLILIRRKLFF